MLKEARLKKGVSLEEVEKEIKIRKKYIEALEEDNYEILPGKVYIKGFLKLYGNYLSLDVPDLLKQFEDSFAEPVEEQPAIEEEASEEKPKFTLNKNQIIIAGVIISLIVLALVIPAMAKLFKNDNKVNPEKDKTQIEQNTEKPAVNENKPKNNAVTPDKVQPSKDKDKDILDNEQEDEDKIKDDQKDDKLLLKVKIIDIGPEKEECWVQLYSDGNKSYEGILEEGQIKTVEADQKIKISLGNAGVAEVYLGKKKLGLLGEEKQVIKNKEFTKDDL
nr:helix-turn-helix domain-containing protein [Desulfonispora thiosulfatigenes]